MSLDSNDFRYIKVKNGKPFFAIINMDVNENKVGNKIVENYIGEGFHSQGYIESVPMEGYKSWKNALRNGLEYILEKSEKSWEIKINSIEGRVGIDTNATVVGYVAILAFCAKTGITLDIESVIKLENFVFNSWNESDDFAIPDYKNLCYQK